MEDRKVNHLVKRNISEIIRQSELDEMLKSGRKLTVYLGVDPSSPEIHLGHAVVLWKLKEFQDLGHRVILLIGDMTAQIGDPTGKSKEREPLTHEQVLENARSYKEQASKILSFSGQNPAVLSFNSHWLAKLTLAELIKLASQFTVQQMIERDMFQERIKAGQPIGLHEFLYPLLQGYDSVELEADVEVGGNDQLFNIKAGRALREKLSHKTKVVLTCDLLIGSDGKKMSKSAGNIIPLNTTPEDMFGKLMAVDDKLIEEYARLCSDMNDDELEKIKNRLKSNENPRDVKLDVAERIVSQYYSKDARVAREKFLATFSRKEASDKIEVYKSDQLEMPLYQLVAKVAKVSNSEARRLILGRAVDVDGQVEVNDSIVLDLSTPKTLKIGKHRFVKVEAGHL